MKRILIFIFGVFLLTSCFKEDNFKLAGTEWVSEEDELSLGLNFSGSNSVTFFISSGATVITAHGYYEYLPSVKKISFDGVRFYNKNTYETMVELKGGQVIDNKTMKISMWFDGQTETLYLYRK